MLSDIKGMLDSYMDSAYNPRNKITSLMNRRGHKWAMFDEEEQKEETKEEKPTSLRQVFLKEKITSNTLIKKLREIVLAFREENKDRVIARLESLLGYKLDIKLDTPKGHVPLEVQKDEFRPISFL